MYITDEELDARIDSDLNLVNKLEIRKLHNGGRRLGDKNIPPIMREIIAIAAHEDGSTAVHKAFGTARSHVDGLKNGIITANLGVNSDFKGRVDAAVSNRAEEAHEAALDALMTSLEIINTEKEKISSPKLASKIASDMASVISKLKGKVENNQINAQQVIIYAPQQKHIAQYDTVDVS